MILLSPAKTLDYETPLPSFVDSATKSDLLFQNQTDELIGLLRKMKSDDIQSLMSISTKLATLNYERYSEWQDLPERPAIYAFMGDVYEGLDINNFTPAEVKRLDKELLILSGLYGAITPLTAIRPYRLEMGTKLKNLRGQDLYAFWGDLVGKIIEARLKKDELIFNLASNEYFKVAKNIVQDSAKGKDGKASKTMKNSLSERLISPVFKDQDKLGKYKVISFWAKKARGSMTSYIVKNKVKHLDELIKFKEGGYRYDKDSSPSKHMPTFLRDH